MEAKSEWLTGEEKEELKAALLDFVKKASRCGYEMPGEAFMVLPAVVDRLTGKRE